MQDACRKERARAVTAVFGSLDVGSAVGLLVCGPLIHAFGWPSVFYLFAALGLLWCVAWPLLSPEQADPDAPAPPPSSGPSVAGMLLPVSCPWTAVPVIWLLLKACVLPCPHCALERPQDESVKRGSSPSGRLARGVPCRKSRALGCISALQPSLGHHCRPLCLQLVRRLHALSVRLLVCTSWQHPCFGRCMLSILLEQSEWLG